MQEIRGTVIWGASGADVELGEHRLLIAERNLLVSNACVVTNEYGEEIAHSTRESGFFRGITETFFINGQPSGLVLKRGMLNTRVNWQGESKLLGLGIQPEPYPEDEDLEALEDSENSEDEEALEMIETRHFLIDDILLEHADHTSAIKVRARSQTSALIGAFLAYRIWAKGHEGAAN